MIVAKANYVLYIAISAFEITYMHTIKKASHKRSQLTSLPDKNRRKMVCSWSDTPHFVAVSQSVHLKSHRLDAKAVAHTHDFKFKSHLIA